MGPRRQTEPDTPTTRDDTYPLVTFPVIDGVRYAVPGDLASVDADGSIADAPARDHEVSEILERLIENEGLLVVGAEYSLETGVVDFFDGVPKAG